MNDSRADIGELVRTLDDEPHPLHSDFTPSVDRLIELGLPAAVAVVDLLDAPDPATRLHAQRVIEGAVMRANGWRPNQGYPDTDGEQRTRRVLEQNGGYRFDAAPEQRKAALERWRAWLAAAQRGSTENERP
jgi:hypothetical protein